MKTIAQIFHDAADKHLSHGDYFTSDKEIYSCWAISRAEHGTLHDPSPRIRIGLHRLGLRCNSTRAFDEFEPGEERQSVRYAWLKFCALLAEEQGV